MILNSSGTAGCDQILKQIMYGGRKVRKKGKRFWEFERAIEERKESLHRCKGVTQVKQNYKLKNLKI